MFDIELCISVHKALSWNVDLLWRTSHFRHPLASGPNVEPHQNSYQCAKYPSVEFLRWFSLAIAFLPVSPKNTDNLDMFYISWNYLQRSIPVLWFYIVFYFQMHSNFGKNSSVSLDMIGSALFHRNSTVLIPNRLDFMHSVWMAGIFNWKRKTKKFIKKINDFQQKNSFRINYWKNLG